MSAVSISLPESSLDWRLPSKGRVGMWCLIAAAAKPAGDARMRAKLVTARFFVERMLPETAAHLARIQAAVARRRDPLRGTAEIALAVGAVVNRYKMAKHFDLDITDAGFSFTRKTAEIAAMPVEKHALPRASSSSVTLASSAAPLSS